MTDKPPFDFKLDAEPSLAPATGSAYRPLAHKDGINLVFGLLMARCKKCGERVERVKMSDIKVVEGRPPGMPNDAALRQPTSDV